jgi:hypothetical protein
VRRLAYAIVIAELARWAVVSWSNQYAAAHFSSAGLAFESRPAFHASAIVTALIILAIAEVFRTGARLETEQSLTI